MLVGHSYGGFVITNAATGGGDVRALVYIDAFIPDEGEFVFQILGGSGSALDVPDPTTVLDIAGYPGAPEGDAEAFLKPDTVHNSFAQDLPEEQRWQIAAGQRPITLSANTTPSVTAAWKTLPSWAVVGTEDLVIPPATQRSMAERAGREDHRGGRLARVDGVAPRDRDRHDPGGGRRGHRLTCRSGPRGPAGQGFAVRATSSSTPLASRASSRSGGGAASVIR